MTIALHLHNAQEFNRRIQANLSKALTIAISIHIFAISIYYIVENWPSEDRIATVRITDINELYQAPALSDVTPPVKVQLTTPEVIAPVSGIPVIVADNEAVAEQTLQTQEEIRTAINAPQGLATDGSEIRVDISQPLTGLDGGDPAADEFIPVEQQPVLLAKLQPEYPELARRANMEGRVILKGLVNEEGAVTKVIVLSGDELFVQSARSSLLAARFKPAINGNRAVKVWITLPVIFRLK